MNYYLSPEASPKSFNEAFEIASDMTDASFTTEASDATDRLRAFAANLMFQLNQYFERSDSLQPLVTMIGQDKP